MSDGPPVVVPPVGGWQSATVTDIRDETASVKTFALALERPMPHLAGQHVVVRLTAPDGYTAQRSYSIASAPDGASVELTVERLRDGEVSTFLHDELQIGDLLEVRGPIGGWFVWDGTSPALLVGGGSGIVPLMSMLRLARRQPGEAAVHLVVSARRPAELIFAAELDADDVTVLYTRVAPAGASRTVGRITADDLRDHVRPDVTVFICGSAGFAARAGEVAMAAGVGAQAIRVERFGPTG